MSHKISDPKFVFGRGSAPDPAGGAHDAPPGCENEAKIKWLYEEETATLGLQQMGNEKVGNHCLK